MALQNATAGGDWLKGDEWLALGAESARVIFRIHGHQPQRDMTNGPVFPVDCDALILSGARAGELHTGQSIIGKGLTTPLRKVAVGDDMLAVMGLGKNGSVTYAQANPPAPDDVERAQAMYAGGKDPFRDAAGAGVVAASAAAPFDAPAPAAARRPWDA